jgi:hypothetical protein
MSMKPLSTRSVIALCTLCFSLQALLSGCLNPFAPIEGEAGSRTWDDQRTVGGLLTNFALAYDYRDSLHYADCLDESFVFNYYDIDAGRYDSWYRDTDLKATGGLFRNYSQIDLEWNLIPDDVVNFSVPDSLLSFVIRFNLTIEQESPLMGFARFAVRMGDDGRFRVTSWRDDF